jgi:hypothetical protein
MWRKLIVGLWIVLSISLVAAPGCLDIGDSEDDEPVVDIDTGND